MTERRVHVNPSNLAQNNSDGADRPALVLQGDGGSLDAHEVRVEGPCTAIMRGKNQAHVILDPATVVRAYRRDGGAGSPLREVPLPPWAEPDPGAPQTGPRAAQQAVVDNGGRVVTAGHEPDLAARLPAPEVPPHVVQAPAGADMSPELRALLGLG